MPDASEDPFEHWAALQPVLLELSSHWADDVTATSRAIAELRAAFGSGVIDIDAVQRGMEFAVKLFEALESDADDQVSTQQEMAAETYGYYS